ncbi:unnamed protein product [Effrenium voratum]|nr:unnamed protein product [Effrenium voratum]CAJ1452148.1 unnamed protein product [Effrenium voratum]
MSKGQEFLKEANWAVCGDVLNPAKAASEVVEALKSKSKTVHLVNPRDSSGTCHVGIKDIGQPVDVVDLCINPVAGLTLVDEMAELGIKKVFIQPGAGSEAVLKRCEEKGIDVFQGCVMIEAGLH